MIRLLKNKKKWASALVACFAMAKPGWVLAQHNMADMPGMQMPENQQKDSDQSREKKRKPRREESGSEKPLDSMSGMEHGQMDRDHMDQGTAPAPKSGIDHEGMQMAPAHEQGSGHDGMAGMEHGVKHEPPERAQNQRGMPGMAMEPIPGMQMGPMQGGLPGPDARDPDAYAEGTKKKSLGGMEMRDDELFGRVLVSRLEAVDARREYGQNLEAEAWYGGDYHKLWLKAEGEHRNGRLERLRTEALWDRAFAAFWSTQLGVRHDTGQGAARDWIAFGVQGLAPYWFETEATAYWGNGGTLAARAEFKYELLITQRLILQPSLEANLYSRNDRARGIGSGLADVELGFRLRYEIRRQFAPYLGVAWRRKFGNTADFTRDAGGKVRESEVVAGIRIWF